MTVIDALNSFGAKWVQMGAEEMCAVTVNKFQARRLIEFMHPKQRRVSEPHVRKLTASMDAGAWDDWIAEYRVLDGFVVDGQHRLTAFLGSRLTSLGMKVSTVRRQESLFAIDTDGRTRRLVDADAMVGRVRRKHSTVAAILMEHFDFDFAQIRVCPALARSTIVNTSPYTACVDALARKQPVYLPSGVLAGVARCLRAAGVNGTDPEMVMVFFAAVAENNQSGDATGVVKLLANWITSSATTSRSFGHRVQHGQLFQRLCAEKAMSAFMAYADGRTLTRLYARTMDANGRVAAGKFTKKS